MYFEHGNYLLISVENRSTVVFKHNGRIYLSVSRAIKFSTLNSTRRVETSYGIL